MQLSVLLTGFEGLDNSGPAGSVATSLRSTFENRISILALVGPLPEPGVISHEAIDKVISIGPENLGDAAFGEAILEAHEHNAFDILIPGTNRSALAAAKSVVRMAEKGIRQLLPDIILLEAAACGDTGHMARRCGLLPQPSLRPATPAESCTLAKKLGYPVLVKSDIRMPEFAFSSAEVEKIFEGEAQARSMSLQLQHSVGGEVWRVAGVCASSGAQPTIVALRPLAFDPLGRISAATIIDDADVLEVGHRFAKILGWRGPFEIELRRMPQGKDFYLCDVRCHLPTWTQTAHAAGVNLTEKIMEAAGLCSRSEAGKLKAGTLYVAGIDEAVVPVEQACASSPALAVAKPPIIPLSKPNLQNQLNVAVTGISSFDVVNPGLGVARALRVSDVIKSVYGLCYGNFDSGLYQPKLLDGGFRLDLDADEDRLFNRISTIHDRHPIDVLVPCLDGELKKFIGIQKQLQELGIATLLPNENALNARSKLGLCKLKHDWGGFQIPQSCIIESNNSCIAACHEIGFPVAIKGPESHCILVTSEADATAAWEKYRLEGHQKVIVQKMIKGQIYAISTVCDYDNNTVSSFSIKKFATCSRGSTWGAVNVPLPELEQVFAHFLKTIHWTGPAEGEFIKDELTDRFYLYEVNPRFTGWISFTAAAGCNQPLQAAMIASGANQSIQQPDQQYIFARRNKEVLLPARHLASLTTRQEIIHG